MKADPHHHEHLLPRHHKENRLDLGWESPPAAFLND